MSHESRIPAMCLYANHGESDFNNIQQFGNEIVNSISRSSDGVTICVVEVTGIPPSATEKVFDLSLKGEMPLDLFYRYAHGSKSGESNVVKMASMALYFAENVYSHCQFSTLNEICEAYPGRIAVLLEATPADKLEKLVADFEEMENYSYSAMLDLDDGEFESAYSLFANYIDLSHDLHADREERLSADISTHALRILESKRGIDGVVVQLGSGHTSFTKRLNDEVFSVSAHISSELPMVYEPDLVLLKKALHNPDVMLTFMEVFRGMLATKYHLVFYENHEYDVEIAKEVQKFARSFNSKKDIKRFRRLVLDNGFKEAASIWNHRFS